MFPDSIAHQVRINLISCFHFCIRRPPRKSFPITPNVSLPKINAASNEDEKCKFGADADRTTTINAFYFEFIQHLWRHVLRNQHKLKRVLQQQIRSCSAAVAVQPNLNAIGEDEKIYKYTDIPAAALETKSKAIDHAVDVGQQFKVLNSGCNLICGGHSIFSSKI